MSSYIAFYTDAVLLADGGLLAVGQYTDRFTLNDKRYYRIHRTIPGSTLHFSLTPQSDAAGILENDRLNGMLIATVALLKRNPAPTDAEARTALQHHLCRCGSHLEILAAVQRAAALVAETTRSA